MEILLAYSKKLNPELKTIITISVRHDCSMRRIRHLMRVAEKHENVGINLVAGNKAYLTAEEREKSAVKNLTKAIKTVKKQLGNSTIFVGTEGLIKTVSRLISKYEITPFLLLDRNLEDYINKIREVNGKCPIAVYTPYLVFAKGNDGSHEVITSLLNYALRRKWAQETLTKEGYNPNKIYELLKREKGKISQTQHRKLKETLTNIIKQLSIFGDSQTISRNLQTLNKISIIVGLPIKEEEKQVRKFANIIQGVNGLS